MKTLKLTAVAILFFMSHALLAQTSVIIGSPPAWGPVGFSGVRYYYLPDVETYYDVQDSRFIYFQPTGWVRSAHLPSRYRHYNLYDGYKVAMTGYNGNSPYDHFSEHKRDFKKGSFHGDRQKTNGEGPGNSNGKGNGKSKNH